MKVQTDAVRRWPATPWIGTALRLLLGAVFLYAGAIKVGKPNQSVRAVAAFDVLPVDLERIVGYALPGLEIALGLLLVVGLLTRVAAGTLAGLLVVFLVGIAQAWARGLSIDCGCFGGGGVVDPDQTQYVQELVRDTGLLVVALWLVRWPRTRLALDTLGSPGGPDEGELDDEPGHHLTELDPSDDDLNDHDLTDLSAIDRGPHRERDTTA